MFYVTKTKKSRGGKKFSFSPLWEPQNRIFTSKAPDPFLLLRYPRLLINLPRNWLFQSQRVRHDWAIELNWYSQEKPWIRPRVFFPKFAFFLHINVQLFQHYLLKKNCNCSIVLPWLFCPRSVDHNYGGLFPCILFCRFTGFPTGSVVKNLSAMQEMQET